MRLIPALNKLAKQVDGNISNLNAGGCGVFASEVAKSLIAKGIPARCFAVCNTNSFWDAVGSPGNIDEARKNISDPGDVHQWHDNGVSLYHVGVEFDWRGKRYHFDSKGVEDAGDTFRKPAWIVQEGRWTADEMDAMAKRPHNWNYEFSRKQIPKIQRYVEEYLNG